VLPCGNMTDDWRCNHGIQATAADCPLCLRAKFAALVVAVQPEAVPAEVAVRFGLVTRRTDLRTFPTARRVFSLGAKHAALAVAVQSYLHAIDRWAGDDYRNAARRRPRRAVRAAEAPWQIAYLEIAALLEAHADDPQGVVCALRERLRECDRRVARNELLEARRERAVDVLEGRRP